MLRIRVQTHFIVFEVQATRMYPKKASQDLPLNFNLDVYPPTWSLPQKPDDFLGSVVLGIRWFQSSNHSTAPGMERSHLPTWLGLVGRFRWKDVEDLYESMIISQIPSRNRFLYVFVLKSQFVWLFPTQDQICFNHDFTFFVSISGCFNVSTCWILPRPGMNNILGTRFNNRGVWWYSMVVLCVDVCWYMCIIVLFVIQPPGFHKIGSDNLDLPKDSRTNIGSLFCHIMRWLPLASCLKG